MEPANLDQPKPPQPPNTEEAFPDVRSFVLATSSGDLIQQIGENAEEYGEILGYLHQLAEKVGECLAFDDVNTIYAKNKDVQFYSEARGDHHIAVEFNAIPSLTRIKRFVNERMS